MSLAPTEAPEKGLLRTHRDESLLDRPHERADDVLGGDVFGHLFEFDLGGRVQGGRGGSRGGRGGEAASTKMVPDGFRNRLGGEHEDVCGT